MQSAKRKAGADAGVRSSSEDESDVRGSTSERKAKARSPGGACGSSSTSAGKKRAKTSEVIELDDEDEFEVVGARAPESASFPHARSECQCKPFRKGESWPGNAEACAQCFCFVCDLPAAQCKRWASDHCHAVSSDVGWRKRRETARLAAVLRAQASGKGKAKLAPKPATPAAPAHAPGDLEITTIIERDEPGWTRLPGPVPVSIPNAAPRRLPAGATTRELFSLYTGPRPPLPAGGFEALPDRSAKVREALRSLATLEQCGYARGRVTETSGHAGARHFRLTILLNFGGYRAVLESPAPPPEVEPVMWLVLQHLTLTLETLPPARRALLDAAACPEGDQAGQPADGPPPFDVAAIVRAMEVGEADWPLLEEGAAEKAGLALQLRPYQRQAVRFMLDQERSESGIVDRLWARIPLPAPQRGSLFYFPLASRLRTAEPPFVRGGFNCEEMGLGKTVEIIALALLNPAPAGRALKEPCCEDCRAAGLLRSRATLVVAPLTLIEQWRREVAKAAPPGGPHAPSVLFWHGADRKRQAALLADHDFVITSYSLLASPGPLHKIAWHRVVLDESHTVRTAGRQAGDAARRLHSHLRWCCTGTPFATRAYDVVGQLHFLLMDPLGEVSTFDAAIGRLFDSRDARGPARLLGVLRGAAVRHSKEQAFRGEKLVVLPPRTVETCEVKLTADERTLYSYLESRAAGQHRALLQTTLRPAAGVLHDLLLPLRQACSHGCLVAPRRLHAASRWQSFAEPADTGGAGGRRPRDEAAEAAAEAVAAAAVPADVRAAYERVAAAEGSSTTTAALRDLKALREEDPAAKAVVFSEFAGTLDRLSAALRRASIPHAQLAGSMEQRARARALEQFLTDPACVALLAPLSVGSAGLNLTAATTVLLLEPPLNPRDEAQAIGRVHRIGQTRPVLARKYVCGGTVEERLAALHRRRHAEVETAAPTLLREADAAAAASAEGPEVAPAACEERSGEDVDPAQVAAVDAGDLGALFDAAASRSHLL